ncbi:TetR/AcrR family transcriptional regulator [Gordonia sp. NPDC003376]
MPVRQPSKRTPAAEVRTNLIRAGREILERDGVAGLTVRDVAKAAGVAPMGVYNHFDGKEGLLVALVTDGFNEFAETIATTDDDPAERLAHSGREYRQFAVKNPTVYTLMFTTECDPAAEPAVRAFLAITEIVRYGQAAGVIRPGNPLDHAMLLWSCVHGAVSLELAGSAPDFIDHESNYEQVIGLIARGLAP